MLLSRTTQLMFFGFLGVGNASLDRITVSHFPQIVQVYPHSLFKKSLAAPERL